MQEHLQVRGLKRKYLDKYNLFAKMEEVIKNSVECDRGERGVIEETWGVFLCKIRSRYLEMGNAISEIFL